MAAEAIKESGATTADPIEYEAIRERYLPEYPFSGKVQHHRSHYALSASAMIRAGVYPDLLGEVVWWNDNDLWWYAFWALVIYLRIAAEFPDVCFHPGNRARAILAPILEPDGIGNGAPVRLVTPPPAKTAVAGPVPKDGHG